MLQNKSVRVAHLQNSINYFIACALVDIESHEIQSDSLENWTAHLVERGSPVLNCCFGLIALIRWRKQLCYRSIACALKNVGKSVKFINIKFTLTLQPLVFQIKRTAQHQLESLAYHLLVCLSSALFSNWKFDIDFPTVRSIFLTPIFLACSCRVRVSTTKLPFETRSNVITAVGIG